MTFSPGDPVICTDASLRGRTGAEAMLSVQRLTEGETYTVEACLGDAVILREAKPFHPFKSYYADRFRPLNRAPAVFREMLERVPA